MNIFIKYFPYFQRNFKKYTNVVVWGIGANMRNPLKTFQYLFRFLAKHPCVQLHTTSYIYKNPPFGYKLQPDFYNTTIIFSTNLCLRSLFALMFYLERKFGRDRVRKFCNAPRTLDIDLIFYAAKHAKFKHLHLPHADYQNRQSVLLPLKFQLGLL